MGRRNQKIKGREETSSLGGGGVVGGGGQGHDETTDLGPCAETKEKVATKVPEVTLASLKPQAAAQLVEKGATLR